MGHASLCTTFDPFQLNSPNFSRDADDGLNQDFEHRAIAVKLWKNIGMEIQNGSGQYVMLDNPAFEPIYRDVAAKGKNPRSSTLPTLSRMDREVCDRRRPYHKENPEWDMSKNPNAPQKAAILDGRDRVLAMYPDLRVIGAHFGSMETHLDELAVRFDRYPNFAVDTAARVETLTLELRDQVRAFFLKYQDRILYGSDFSFDTQAQHKGTTSASWEKQYLLEWRYFSTDDTFDYHNQQVEGLDLPLPVLEKLYHDNAVRWIPGIDTNAR
jgi:predicted TIM-barrel fold metal-dependent hydrolase